MSIGFKFLDTTSDIKEAHSTSFCILVNIPHCIIIRPFLFKTSLFTVPNKFIFNHYIIEPFSNDILFSKMLNFLKQSRRLIH